jgi:hypothetical protein
MALMFADAQEVFPIFFGTWVALGILGSYLFIIRNDYEFKVKYFKYFVILVGVLFIGFAAAMAPPPEVFLVMVPLVILFTIVNIKCTRFCRNCGKTINAFYFAAFCPKCGKKLKDE